MADYILAPVAAAELASLLEYIEIHSSAVAAQKISARILASLETLAAFPTMGRLRRGPAEGARIFSIRPWIVFYEPQNAGRGIRVLRIIDGRRDLSEIL